MTFLAGLIRLPPLTSPTGEASQSLAPPPRRPPASGETGVSAAALERQVRAPAPLLAPATMPPATPGFELLALSSPKRIGRLDFLPLRRTSPAARRAASRAAFASHSAVVLGARIHPSGLLLGLFRAPPACLPPTQVLPVDWRRWGLAWSQLLRPPLRRPTSSPCAASSAKRPGLVLPARPATASLARAPALLTGVRHRALGKGDVAGAGRLLRLHRRRGRTTDQPPWSPRTPSGLTDPTTGRTGRCWPVASKGCMASAGTCGAAAAASCTRARTATPTVPSCSACRRTHGSAACSGGRPRSCLLYTSDAADE